MKLKRNTLFSLSLIVYLATSGIVQAGGDYETGKEKAAVCFSCHGSEGISISPQFPNLAGQYQDYLERALLDYRDGTRNNIIMKSSAEKLTDEDIEDLAAYFAAQKALFTPSQGQW